MRLYCLTLALAIAFFAVPDANAEVDALRDLRPAITECWEPPPAIQRLEVTVRFSLNSRGGVIGRPAITYSNLSDDEALNREFVASVLSAVANCTPVKLSAAFADAMAGRPVTIRFLWDKRRRWIAPRTAAFPFSPRAASPGRVPEPIG